MGLLRKIVNKLFYEYFDIILMKNIKNYLKKKLNYFCFHKKLLKLFPKLIFL